MVFSVNDETWALIMFCYEQGGEFLSPTTKILVENLLTSLQINRTITSSSETDLLVTLLLSCSQSQKEATEDKDKQPTHNPTKDNWHGDSANLFIRINLIIEQLRIFSAEIDAHPRDYTKEQSR